MVTRPSSQPMVASMNTVDQVPSKSDLFLKNSCGDLQSRLKVRKVLGVGESTGSICSSKISQILGQSDNLINLSPKLVTWLFFTATFYSCLTVTGIVWPCLLRFFLPGGLESTIHLATSYAFLATILALTLRSGDRTSLQLVLYSLILFHALSFIVALWLLKSSDTKAKSTISVFFHLICLLVNMHFYRSTYRPVTSLPMRPNKFKSYFDALLNFPSAAAINTERTSGHDSS